MRILLHLIVPVFLVQSSVWAQFEPGGPPIPRGPVVPRFEDADIKAIPEAEPPEQPCVICDAAGRPIPFASVTAELQYPRRAQFPDTRPGKTSGVSQMEIRTIHTVSSRRGAILLPQTDRCQISLTVRRRGYGVARMVTNYPPFRGSSYSLPVVAEGSAESQRALRGRVVDSMGNPLPGAAVEARSIRTPGMGLINPQHPIGQVVTDRDGEFVLYMPSGQNDERGRLIPPGSRFQLHVTFPNDKQIYPASGYYSNSEPAEIQLDTTAPIRRFVIQTEDGKVPVTREVASQYSIYRLSYGKDRSREYHPVDTRQALLGVRMPPGEYHASRHGRLGTLNYLPLKVSADSDRVLTFKLPMEVTLRGRVVDGVTGEPLPGAFVAASYSSGSGSLAMLTDEQWKTLYELPSVDDLEGEHLKILKPFFGARALVRADRNAEFSLTEPLDRPYYGLIFFAEDRIPYMVRKPQFQDQKTKEWKAVTVPLFKSATVTLTPTFDADRLSISPEWIINKDGQPDWFPRFEEANSYRNGDFAFDSWMKLNEEQPIFVPAGLKLRLRLRVPYNKEVANVVCSKEIQLAPGEDLKIGEVQMPPTIPLTVRVVGPNGNPLEGVPVRRLHDDENAWCVAHNTDASGLAVFGANPNSTGKVRAGEYQKAPTAPFRVETSKLDAPIEIKLTRMQIDRIFRQKN